MKKIYNFFKKHLMLILLFVCLVTFLALAEDVFKKEIMQGDVIGYELISTYLINNTTTPIMKVITWFGSATCLIVITIVLLLLLKNKKVVISIFSNLVIVTIFNQILKFILQRPRPDEYRIIDESGYSFPSGHSMISMSFYGLLIYLIYKYINNKFIKIIAISILFLLILLIGISRVYLGVHYTSDVLAGFLIAISYLIVFISMFNKTKIFKN